MKRVTLPPAAAPAAAGAAALQAEGLLPEGVTGDTAAGEADAGHRVWIAAVSAASRGGVGGPVADAATGLAALLASDLGLRHTAAERLEAGVLLLAAEAGRVQGVRLDASGPAESVVVDADDGWAAALADRLDGPFVTAVAVGEPVAGGVWPGVVSLDPGEALARGAPALEGAGWRAAGAAAAAALPSLPVLGADPQQEDDGRGAPPPRLWIAAAAAVVVGLVALAAADLSAAARLDEALAARPELAEAQAELAADTARFAWLESGGPTPLAVLDELTALSGGVVPAKIVVGAGKITLEGSVQEASALDGFVDRLAGAETFTAVKVQQSEKVGDNELKYVLNAVPVDRFYDAFVPAPAGEEGDGEEERPGRDRQDAGAPDAVNAAEPDGSTGGAE
ncbi:hypothetical protein PSMK_14000 [Phycisphaera mikurensis NBRC 102666]|uniref:Uncharacterized protein n=1 Tax=Phycisphaera mikurensis (strain NBRC 102666 / KCTC 22515 / FYK2301M01) TaxID=1142394 RepID=I0IE71_PHYMF|nr:hypothetical protein PSMK_14000 [Phycisphaera mikurensis NBRC 102666]